MRVGHRNYNAALKVSKLYTKLYILLICNSNLIQVEKTTVWLYQCNYNFKDINYWIMQVCVICILVIRTVNSHVLQLCVSWIQGVPGDSSLLDSDSDLEDIRHVIIQSHKQLVFSEDVFRKQLARSSPGHFLASDFVSNLSINRMLYSVPFMSQQFK